MHVAEYPVRVRDMVQRRGGPRDVHRTDRGQGEVQVGLHDAQPVSHPLFERRRSEALEHQRRCVDRDHLSRAEAPRQRQAAGARSRTDVDDRLRSCRNVLPDPLGHLVQVRAEHLCIQVQQIRQPCLVVASLPAVRVMVL